jgi:hypothetical protein
MPRHASYMPQPPQPPSHQVGDAPPFTACQLSIPLCHPFFAGLGRFGSLFHTQKEGGHAHPLEFVIKTGERTPLPPPWRPHCLSA